MSRNYEGPERIGELEERRGEGGEEKEARRGEGGGEKEKEERKRRKRHTPLKTADRGLRKRTGRKKSGGVPPPSREERRAVPKGQCPESSSAVVCPRPATETDPLKPPYEGSGEA